MALSIESWRRRESRCVVGRVVASSVESWHRPESRGVVRSHGVVAMDVGSSGGQSQCHQDGTIKVR